MWSFVSHLIILECFFLEHRKHQRKYEKMSLKLEKKAAHKIISKPSKFNIKDKNDYEEK